MLLSMDKSSVPSVHRAGPSGQDILHIERDPYTHRPNCTFPFHRLPIPTFFTSSRTWIVQGSRVGRSKWMSGIPLPITSLFPPPRPEMLCAIASHVRILYDQENLISCGLELSDILQRLARLRNRLKIGALSLVALIRFPRGRTWLNLDYFHCYSACILLSRAVGLVLTPLDWFSDRGAQNGPNSTPNLT